MESERFAAARRGDRRFHGTPCTKCGTTERYVVNGACVECTRQRKKSDSLKIRELLKQADHAHESGGQA